MTGGPGRDATVWTYTVNCPPLWAASLRYEHHWL